MGFTKPTPLKEHWEKLINDENINLNVEFTQAFETMLTRLELRSKWVAEIKVAQHQYDETGLHLTQQELEEWLEKVKAGENVPMPEVHT